MNKEFIIFRFYENDELLNQEVKLVTEKTINDHLSNNYSISYSEWCTLVSVGEITLKSFNNKIVLTCF